ncbi:MAG: hypothetical protein JXR60_05480 [Bacteroidales bacterium]|nr:hypothetical protein [Bacteroidales bacterium]
MPPIQSTSEKFLFEYKEELYIPQTKKQRIVVGLLKENHELEQRVALTPFTVNFFVENGAEVLIESGAGEASGFTDIDYSEAGGQIHNEQSVIFKADIIFKISPLSVKQIGLMEKGKILISTLNIRTLNTEYFKALSQKKVTAIALEYIRNRAGVLPFVQIMNEISGMTAVNFAANFYREKRGKLIGGIEGIKPAELVVFGSCSAIESAIRSAIGVGASVKVFDLSMEGLNRLQRAFGKNLYTSMIHSSIVNKELERADIVIGSVNSTCNLRQHLITEEQMHLIKKGALVIDLSIDKQPCFETSKETTIKNPFYYWNGLTNIALPNFPSLVPRTASYAISNIFFEQFSNISEITSMSQLFQNIDTLRAGLYIYNGVLVNEEIAKYFNIPSQDLGLILSAF